MSIEESFADAGKAAAQALASVDEVAKALNDISKIPLWKTQPRVMISINPKWCELIASGEKTIEVRKTKPKIETPFKCYIYCTNPKTKNPHEILEIHSEGKIYKANGKVIGEFICDEIAPSIPCYKDYEVGYWDILNSSCLTLDELMQYGKWGMLYGWHISDLVIYDKPKELRQFRTPCKKYFEQDNPRCGDCDYYCERYEYPPECACEGMKPIKRPPQSWCYVEKEG